MARKNTTPNFMAILVSGRDPFCSEKRIPDYQKSPIHGDSCSTQTSFGLGKTTVGILREKALS